MVPSADTTFAFASTGQIAMVRDLVQIAFFVTIGVVTVLTYRRARRTLFQPMRVEVFKRQLDEVSRLLGLVARKSEAELRDEFATDALFEANAHALLEHYGTHFFDWDIPEEQRARRRFNCRYSVIDPAALTVIDGDVQEDPSSESRESSDPRVRAALWSEQAARGLDLPAAYFEAKREVEKALEAPLLPSRVARSIEGLLATLHYNEQRLRETLSAAATEMPERYPNEERLRRASTAWIRNKYYEGVGVLKPQADAIVSEVRRHYDVDALFRSD